MMEPERVGKPGGIEGFDQPTVYTPQPIGEIEGYGAAARRSRAEHHQGSETPCER